MTREEAIDIIKCLAWHTRPNEEDIELAIQVLSAETCDSKNEVMNFPETWEEYEEYYGFNDTEEVYSNNIRLIPSFRVKQWLEHLKTEPCEDCIRRKSVIDVLTRNRVHFCDMVRITSELKDLPPVTPKQRTGMWEWVQYDYNPKLGNWHCSECRSIVVECVTKEEKGGIPLYKYCPQCGAKMEGGANDERI